MKKIAGVLALVTMICWSWPGHAALLYAEGPDLSNSLAAPTVLGALTVGSNTVSGAVAGQPDSDHAQFVVPVGHILNKLLLLSCSPSACFDAAFGLDFIVRDASDDSLLFHLNRPVGQPLPKDVLDSNSLAAGTYKLIIDGANLFGAPSRSYELDLQLAAIPVPAALPLLLTGLLGLGAMGWRARRSA